MAVRVLTRLTRGQAKPYASVPRIDWSHPLAQGLIFYGYDTGNGSVVDLVAGRPQTVVGSAAPIGMSPFGPGLAYGGATSIAFASDAAIRAPSIAGGPFSYACAYYQTGTVGSYTRPFCRTAENAGGQPYQNWDFEINPSGAGQFAVDYFVNVAGSVTSYAPSWWSGNLNNQFATLLGTHGGGNATPYAQGIGQASTSHTPANDSTNDAIIFSGASSSSVVSPFIGFVYYGALWGRVLTPAEALLLHNDPYCFLSFPEDDFLEPLVGISAGGITGTLNVTQDDQTIAATGFVTPILSSFVPAPLSFGRFRVQRGPFRIRPDTVGRLLDPGFVTGTLSVTQDNQTLAGTATVDVSGTLATTEAGDTAAVSGSVAWVATLATTEAGDTASLNGTTAWNAVLAATEAGDTAAIVGQLGVIGALAATEAADTAAINGTIAWLATLAATEASDTAAINGFVAALGTLAATEAADTAAVAGTVAWLATLAATEGADTAAIAGNVFSGASGSLAATEASDTAAITGSLNVFGPLATTEAADHAAINGLVAVLATLAATEARDTAAIAGLISAFGALVATEAADTAAIFGNIPLTGVTGVLAANEAADHAVILGTTDTTTQPGYLQFGHPRIYIRRW